MIDHIIFYAVILVTLLAALLVRRRWLHTLAALLMVLVNSYVLIFSFDAAARAAAIQAPVLNPSFTEYQSGVQAMRKNIFNYRFLLVFSSMGLCSLILLPANKKAASIPIP